MRLEFDLPHLFHDQADRQRGLMQLVEEGKMQVSDPVSKYLPEIGKMKVGIEGSGPTASRCCISAIPTRRDDGAGPAAPHVRA